MTDDLGYLYALGEARSCLAALADLAAAVEESSYFDQLLIYLDLVTDGVGPACFPRTGTCAELLARLEGAVDRLVEYGVDGLSVELLLSRATDAPFSHMDLSGG